MQGGRSAEGGGRKECRRGREEGVQKGERGCGGKECRRGRGDAGEGVQKGERGCGGKERPLPKWTITSIYPVT